MPVVLRIKGYRFYFFSNENAEPMHIHITKADANGKVWLEPIIETAYFYGFTSKQQKEIEEIIKENSDYLKRMWDEYFKKQ
ncbi:DUF4160 domain-containing protein [Mariniphaga sp.]|uniref:DUF4160 domain-containing protein n=1 Tax=Mariniphaga sp. TaxID=1954475 RepID=UPI0035675384